MDYDKQRALLHAANGNKMANNNNGNPQQQQHVVQQQYQQQYHQQQHQPQQYQQQYAQMRGGMNHPHHHSSRSSTASTSSSSSSNTGYRSRPMPGAVGPAVGMSYQVRQAYPMPAPHGGAPMGVAIPKDPQQGHQRSRQSSLSTVSSISSSSNPAWGDDSMSRASRYSSASSVASSVSSSYPGGERWSPQQTSNACYQCHERFTILKRSHRCRRCGYLFCQKCSRFKAALAGHTHKSRVCEKCFPKLIAGNKPPANSFIHSKAWVPRGMFAHMLSYLNHVDLCLASMTCRFWNRRALLDITWRPLYIREFGDDENNTHRESMIAFQRDIHGIGFDKLSWNQKFAIRWTARKAAEKKKSFLVMSSLLASLGLSKYAPIFEQEEIDIESLCLMNAGHLRDLGIPFGPRMKLLNAAACLADFNEEEEEDRPSMESKPVTPISRFKQKRAEMKHYRASLVRRVQQSAVRIAILTNEGELCNVGSGIIIHENGLIATARHCLQGEQFDCIYSDDYMILVAPTESTSLPPLWKYHAKVIPECCDEELDYALLRIDCEVMSDPPSGIYLGDVTDRIIARNWNVTKIEGTSERTIGRLPAVLIGNSNNVEPGDEMWMFGYPSSGHNTITVHHAICSGTDSQIYDGEEVDKAMLRTAAQLDNGFSGGAAVDKKGQLVGLISFSVLRQDRVRAINMVKGAIELAKRKYIDVQQ